MKCPKTSICFHTGITLDCSACKGTGWLPFWTPAERAGLKAIGRVNLSCIDGSFTHREPMQYAIRAYVAASRRAKEKE